MKKLKTTTKTPMTAAPLLAPVLSIKGKNWDGEKLTEDNLKSSVKVMWRNNTFFTGNRYHNLVELYKNGDFYRVARMKYVSLVKHVPTDEANRCIGIESNNLLN